MYFVTRDESVLVNGEGRHWGGGDKDVCQKKNNIRANKKKNRTKTHRTKNKCPKTIAYDFLFIVMETVDGDAPTHGERRLREHDVDEPSVRVHSLRQDVDEDE